MALGDGIRRNIATITDEERTLFVKALLKLDDPLSTFVYGNNAGQQGVDPPGSGNITYWDMQEQIHKVAHASGIDVHAGPAFTPWHRALINHLEVLLRQVDPRLSLHYWDWTTDPRVAPGGGVAILTGTAAGSPQGFMGSSSGDAGAPFQNFESTEKVGDPLNGIPGDGVHDHIWRGLSPGNPPVDSDDTIIGNTDFDSFNNSLQNAHNNAHGYIGGTIGGGAFASHFSFHDPFVFLLHSNMDRLWATWQRNPLFPDRLNPAVDPATGTAKAYGNILSLEGQPSNYYDELIQPWAGGTSLEPWQSDASQRVLINYKDPSVILPPSYDTALHTSYIVTERDSFSTYELETTLLYPQSFQVIYDGFTPNEIVALGSTPTITFINSPGGLALATIHAQNPVMVAENAAAADTPQRITFSFDIRFDNNSDFPQPPSPPGPDIRDIYLSAVLSGQVDIAPLRLTNQPNPYMIDIQGGNPGWLSTDVRVFQLKPHENVTGSTVTAVDDPGTNPDAPYQYIQRLLTECRGHGNTPDSPFENISQDEQTSQLELLTTVNVGMVQIPVMNFAIAKVRYRASAAIPANDVRVFFRTFNTMVSALDYHTDTNYPRRADGLIPLPGFIGNESASIPYFAERRVSSALQSDDTNKQTIAGSGGESIMYFGCWLDFNQPSATIDIPGGGTASIMNSIRGIHQCMVAEIRFQPGATDPIIIGATPGSSDHLAQRNLAIADSDNPGVASTHVVQHTLLVKPSNVNNGIGLVNRAAIAEGRTSHDELVIRWNNLPRDTKATLFFPEWNVDEVLLLAASLRQGPKLLQKVDANTIECAITDISYIPIPGNNNKPFAGLMTLQLPPTVRTGQLFKVDVQQHSGLRTQRSQKSNDKKNKIEQIVYSVSKRKVLGAFRMTIPVKMGEALLQREIRNLAVLRYIAQSIPAHDRWYRIFDRYIGQIAEKVRGLGVDPGLIKASPHDPGIPNGEHTSKQTCDTGKICEVIYDCFGDLEGFILETCSEMHHFKCQEKGIAKLALRACKDRLLISVYSEREMEMKICKIIVRC